MDCPQCYGKTEVINTRYSKNLGRWRERHCQKCGEVFRTTEIVIDAVDDYKAISHELNEMRQIVNRLRDDLYDILGG